MSLLKTSAAVGSLTMLSRSLGFIRDLLIAYLLGTGFAAEAFFVAQRLPNLFRALFAEGAFNNSFVPQFAGRLESDDKLSAFKFAHDVYSVLGLYLIMFCGFSMLAMPWLIVALAPGFSHDAETSRLTVELTRICFPFLFFISLVALLTGILNSLGRFVAPALAPIFMNLTMIVVCFIVWNLSSGNFIVAARFLSYGVSLSGLVQLLLLAWLAAKVGFKIFPAVPRVTPDVKATLRTAVPGIISGGISQFNLAFATALASGITGGVAFLYYAERLFELPLGVIGVTVGVVLLPALSRKFRANDHDGIQEYLNRGLELSMFLTLPASAALGILGGTILHVIFEHGAFGPGDTANVAPALTAFATSLPAFTASKVLQSLFYARQDVKTPMKFAIMSAVVNIIASLILAHFFLHVGIAAATSIAAWLNAGLLLATACHQGHYVIDQKFKSRFIAMVLSTAVMWGVLWAMLRFTFAKDILLDQNPLSNFVGLVALICVGAIAYILSAYFTKAFALRDLVRQGN